MVPATRRRTVSQLTVALQLLGSGLAEAYSNHGVCFFRGAFSPSECDRLVAVMQTRPVERDVRPDQSVSRVNYWDNTEVKKNKRKKLSYCEAASMSLSHCYRGIAG